MSSACADDAWPALPTKGFIAGRPATERDVKNGDAAFVAKVGDTLIGKPLAIAIPQYAYWTDENGRKIKVVVIQAESSNGIDIVGLRDAAGVEIVATLGELELLGQSLPK